MRFRTNVLLLASMAAIAPLACGRPSGPVADAHLRFVIDAPFCGNAYPVNFFIDGSQVSRDTMWFGVGSDTSPVGPSANRPYKSYRSFVVPGGIHTVRAAIVDTMLPSRPFVYEWPDTTMSVPAGAEAVRKLPFYCS